MSEEADQPETEEALFPLPAGTEISFEDAAENMRRSTGALATEVYTNLEPGTLDPPSLMAALATGALAWAVDAYFRYLIACGMPPSAIRISMNNQIKATWDLALAAHANRGK